MTRINLIDPSLLLDQHLMAEYREMPMVFSAFKRSLSSKNGISGIPKAFTLNAGHVKFFYNKLPFLLTRYDLLVDELISRQYNIDLNRRLDSSLVDWYSQAYWLPSKSDIALSVERILCRYNQKPTWYKMRSKPCHNYNKLLEQYYG